MIPDTLHWITHHLVVVDIVNGPQVDIDVHQGGGVRVRHVSSRVHRLLYKIQQTANMGENIRPEGGSEHRRRGRGCSSSRGWSRERPSRSDGSFQLSAAAPSASAAPHSCPGTNRVRRIGVVGKSVGLAALLAL